MQKKNNSHELVIKNERIWNFYNSHTSINFETANLLLVEFLETMFNKITSNESSINSQILTYMQAQNSQISQLQASPSGNTSKVQVARTGTRTSRSLPGSWEARRTMRRPY